MAQKMIEIKRKEDLREIGIQTEDKIELDCHIQLTKNKYIKLYKSKCFNEYILSLNINKSKKIVVTKSMWKIIKANIKQIDGALLDN